MKMGSNLIWLSISRTSPVKKDQKNSVLFSSQCQHLKMPYPEIIISYTHPQHQKCYILLLTCFSPLESKWHFPEEKETLLLLKCVKHYLVPFCPFCECKPLFPISPPDRDISPSAPQLPQGEEQMQLLCKSLLNKYTNVKKTNLILKTNTYFKHKQIDILETY